jgi:hypothetical protein
MSPQALARSRQVRRPDCNAARSGSLEDVTPPVAHYFNEFVMPQHVKRIGGWGTFERTVSLWSQGPCCKAGQDGATIETLN